MPKHESLLFDREEVVRRGEYEIEHDHLYMEDPPAWWTKFFFGCDNTTRNAYNMSRVIAEMVVMRFEMKLMDWVNRRIDARINEHCETHHDYRKKDDSQEPR